MKVKLNNKGFAISTIMYIILVFALLLVIATMTILSSRKLILDKTKKEVLHKIQKVKYKIGDKITYNGIDFYVIADSPTTQDHVTLLKAEPLTVDEVNEYGTDSNGINHVNQRHKDQTPGIADNWNGYGSLQYYSSKTCGYVGNEWIYTNCLNSYDDSEIKYVIDRWASEKLNQADLKVINTYAARLISHEELINNLGCTWSSCNTETTPKWVYNNNYFTMSGYSNDSIWMVSYDGDMGTNAVSFSTDTVRPVINLKKSAI